MKFIYSRKSNFPLSFSPSQQNTTEENEILSVVERSNRTQTTIEDKVPEEEFSVHECLASLGDDAIQKKFILFSLFVSERLSQSLMGKIIRVLLLFNVKLPRLNHQKFLTALYNELVKEDVMIFLSQY